MPTPSTSSLHPPEDWVEFENIVCDIYRRKWNDEHTQRYGRQGQLQHGIDIYGRKNNSNSYIAIQCKRYDKKKLNGQTIRSDVLKAESFPSQINEYLIATTKPKDKKIQDFIRDLNEERKSENKFTVHIIFWDDIKEDLVSTSNRDLLEKYYFTSWKDIFPNSQKEEEIKRSCSLQGLLYLDIRSDCKLLQELLEYNDYSFLSDKWYSCLSQNRSISQDTSSRIILLQGIGTKLMENVYDFYRQLDEIEGNCKDLLAVKLKVQPMESKPRRGSGWSGHDSRNPPAWTEKYLTDSDMILIGNIKMEHLLNLNKVKDRVRIVLEYGNEICNKLS